MNAHRNNFRRELGSKDYRCTTCGTVANTRTAQQIHADLFEPRAYLDARGLAAALDGGES